MREQKLSPQYIAVDVETTGKYPSRGDRVIEIGAVLIKKGVMIAEFTSLINVKRKIPPCVQKIHGINNEMLCGQPAAEKIYPDFKDFIGNHILIAHNASFDMAFLRSEFRRLGLALNNHFVCTLEMSRRLFPTLPNHRLETVARHIFGALPDNQQRHRALDDARLAARIWAEMVNR